MGKQVPYQIEPNAQLMICQYFIEDEGVAGACPREKKERDPPSAGGYRPGGAAPRDRRGHGRFVPGGDGGEKPRRDLTIPARNLGPAWSTWIVDQPSALRTATAFIPFGPSWMSNSTSIPS